MTRPGEGTLVLRHSMQRNNVCEEIYVYVSASPRAVTQEKSVSERGDFPESRSGRVQGRVVGVKANMMVSGANGVLFKGHFEATGCGGRGVGSLVSETSAQVRKLLPALVGGVRAGAVLARRKSCGAPGWRRWPVRGCSRLHRGRGCIDYI